jgi:DHA2 family multidrug resistance protein
VSRPIGDILSQAINGGSWVKLAQPSLKISLAKVCLALLLTKDAGDGSAVFNIARNLGGSVGTALLDTILTRREQFHDFQIGTYVNAYRPLVQERINYLTTLFLNKGFDAGTATNQAYDQIKNTMRRDAYIMAFNDAFLIVCVALLIGAILVWFCQKTKEKEGAVAH